MSNKTRLSLILSLTLVGLLTVLLAASLSNLNLRQGAPFPGAGSEAANPDWEPPEFPVATGPLFQGFLALVFVSLLLFLLISLVKKVQWGRVLRVIVILGLILALLILLPPTESGQIAPVQKGPSNQVFPVFEYRTAPMGGPPPALIWTVAAGILLSLAYVGYRLYRRDMETPSVGKQLGDQAEKALRSLRSGQKLENVIMQCYVEMSRVLQAQKGIERQPAMTTREFEDLLTDRQIPREPVQKLTRLFEAVRYGDRQLEPADMQTGLECLSEISNYCRAERQMH